MWQMEGLKSRTGKMLSHRAAGLSVRYKEQHLDVLDMKSAMPGRRNSSKESGDGGGGLGGEGQCLGDPCALTAVQSVERCSFWTRQRLIRGDIPDLVMLRMDKEPQDFQETCVNAAFILFRAGCFEQFHLTEKQKSFNHLL